MQIKSTPKILKSNQEVVKRKILYSMAVYGEEEMQAVLDSMENRWLASGPLVKEFEEKISALFGKKYGVAVNSGSSANLLAIQTLEMPEGSEIITPACTFNTTVSAIVHNRLIPVFIDCVIGRYTLNEDLVESAISSKTKAILAPHLVGGVCDLERLRQICNKHKLFLIDDSCDTLAPQLDGESISIFGDITTTSFYGSHIITALGFGGMLMTDDIKVRNKAITLRDWGRVGDDKESFENRFDFEIEGIPYDSKFLYSEPGYNLKMNESAAAFGLAQLNRLNGFLKTRSHNFRQLYNFFSRYNSWFYLPHVIPGSITNWLAFPLTIKNDAPFKRYDLLKFLEDKGIQTRVLFSGNALRHPFYKKIKSRVVGTLENSDQVMAAGFLLGCHQGMTEEDVKYVIKSTDQFLSRFINKSSKTKDILSVPNPVAYENLNGNLTPKLKTRIIRD
jgi:CDP-4-dehydro-6-deoxyglucose reductase, E1